MKTFLHYTKQKELDEGFMSALGGVASGVVRGAKSVGRGVSNVASALSSEKAQSIGAMLGGKTGKVTDALSAVSDMKEKEKLKRIKCKKIKTIELPRAQRELQKAQNSGNKDDEDYWTNELEELKQDVAQLKC